MSENDFPFEEGDEVLVRVRENGDSGNIEAKFTGECSSIRDESSPGSATARIALPWGTMNSVTLRAYEADFEVVA